MLYGRRLDEALEHVDGSRYALVHAVSKRARQITLWLTADPAELRAESAPPPVAGELVTRDPVALSEAEILQGEVRVRWNPDGLGGDDANGLGEGVSEDVFLLEGLGDEDDDGELGDDADGALTPALSQVLEGEAAAEAEAEAEDDESEESADPEDELGEASLEDLQEQELNADDEDDEEN